MSRAKRTGTVAIIGAGEMGAAVGQRMRETGARVLTTLDGRSPASVQRVKRARLEIVEEDDLLAREASFILSIVPPGQALEVAERFHAPMMRATEKPTFIECNAVSPATVCRIADMLAPAGCNFVDAGIVGGPPISGRLDRGPRFYVSGPDAHLTAALISYGLDFVIIDGPVGAASALKMSYAGLTKGLIAIGAAMIGGASRAGLAAALCTELERSQPELLAILRTRMTTMFPKAYRWIAEMQQIGEFLGGPGNGSAIYEGAARLYEQISTEWEKDGGEGTGFIAAKTFLGG
jgi:L-threonate 2-dehydrogenase